MVYKTRAALVMPTPGKLEIHEVDLDAPRQGELTVRMLASGLCHSDDHIINGSVVPGTVPMCVGHEGAGEVVEVGPGTPGWEVGDRVVFGFVPACGRCRWCALGMQNLCDLGAFVVVGSRFDDETSFRMSLDGTPVSQFCGISTLSEYTTVSTASAVKVPKDLPPTSVCLLSCGVQTGWGSSVNSAEVRPGDTVIIVGLGGVGMSAVQGASFAGASHVLAVDTVEFKREQALNFGATHTFCSLDEAADFARSLTNGQGADSVVVTVGVLTAAEISGGIAAIRKAGTLVLTAAGAGNLQVELPTSDITMSQKRITGTLAGAWSPHTSIPTLLRLYTEGHLKLDEMVTTSYKLDDVNDGFRDMLAGKNIRGVVDFT
ncbi:NDMA-dependent alcohol dehydrogenase [Nocardia sp. NPDC057272]|uniref:NDMA-dependent alcohol dehydrogenase n=1 Tax=Nocardia sp. NPDC057272 TaxID=3346079 RepID=UPI0036254550